VGATAVEITSAIAVDELSARVLSVPTDRPEADGTLSWEKTTVLLVQAGAGGETGLGFGYTGSGAAGVVSDALREAVVGGDALSPPAAWRRMRAAVRNMGYPGLASSAIAAVDIAL
jgi:L-alanine-DL-glutamate epimerase-like enolase superfamily enzyme